MKHYYLLFIIFIFWEVGFIKAQNNPPMAIGEEVMPVFDFDNYQADTTILVNLLLNDFDPDGDPIEIAEVKNRYGQENLDILFSDSSISLTMSQSRILEQGYDYRVREKGDTSSVSNWATLIVNPSFDPDFPVAKNDTVTIYPSQTAIIDVLANDYHPLGDTLILHFYLDGDSVVVFEYPQYVNDSFLRFTYTVSDTTAYYLRFDMAYLYVYLANNTWYDSLNINNINARFNYHGNHFWDLDSKQYFKVPNGSEISSVFSQTFWIGGMDENEDLHVAGDRYMQQGMDYWAGPVSEIYDSIYDKRWHHIWKLNRADIEFHKSHWWEAGYEPIRDILTWPGNGDTEAGQSEKIAPFEDINGNGIYEPIYGDAPIIKGDQALFFVFNDDRDLHGESGGIPLGIEIRAMAYAFDSPEDSVLWNTIFWHYDIENRSDTNYHDVYMGVFTDTDLGGAWDDRIECDVESGMYFTYNGTEDDQGGYEQPGYGEHPPAQGIQILGGPYLEPDGIDNPKYDLLGNQVVDESINGLNFGDGIIDNERIGMTGFMYFNSGGSSWMNDPTDAFEYYNTLRSYWHDDVKLQYGGYGHPTALAEGPDCNFMWPRDTDPYNWGTYGLWPNGGYNQDELYWTEDEVGALPGDRRGLGSTGPFRLNVGQVQSLDVAMTWARDYEGTAWSSALLLKDRAAYLKELFQDNPDFFAKVDDIVGNNKKLQVFPNPASNKIRVTIPDQNSGNIVYVFDSRGILVYEKTNIDKNNLEINIQQLSPGLYIIKLVSDKEIQTETFIKL